MSNAEFGERTERPTERRRREARARGEVARSSELVSALVLLSAGGGLWWLGPTLELELASLMRSGLSASPVRSIDVTFFTGQIWQIAGRLSYVALPILLCLTIAAAAANLIQSGFLWVPTALVPQLGRLNPARGFARWFSFPSWTGLVWTLLKLGTLPTCLVLYLRLRLTSAHPLAAGTPGMMVGLAARLVGELTVILALALVLLALVDYGLQFWWHERRLMMTIEEVRQEQREDAVNPQIRRRRQERAAGTSPVATRDVENVRPI